MTPAENDAIALTHGNPRPALRRTRYAGLETRFDGGRYVFRPHVKVRTAAGDFVRVRFGSLEDATFAALIVDLASMIVGREARNFSPEAFQQMSQTRLARAWALTLERLVLAGPRKLATELASRTNPFRPGAADA